MTTRSSTSVNPSELSTLPPPPYFNMEFFRDVERCIGKCVGISVVGHVLILNV
jgi:hypothetical protein